ncbi:MAG: penicillin-binding protein 1C [Gemmatimonadaceae bacterium]
MTDPASARRWRRRRRRVAAICALTLAPVAALAAWVSLPLPASLVSHDGTGQGVTIEDRHGLALRSTRAAGGDRARWVPYDELDPDLINAFVATEDRRFWEHAGVDLRAVARAAWDGARAGRVVSGASTITMQLARLVRPAERDWGGKLAQALWALRIERHLSKQQILEQYLNRVQLGQATVGVGAASSLYLRTSASETSIGDAALLAGIASAPSRDNPHVSPRRARARRATALARMERLGYASREDAARARAEPLAPRGGAPAFLAPHFTTRVIGWHGDAGVAAGATLHTSLDLGLQTELEAEVRHTVAVLADRGVEQAALVVLDNETGETLAWVGSPDFWSADDGQTDMVVSTRQPGSALKPFLYALALDRGYTAATVLPDVPKTYATATGGYQPRNYDRRFRGPVRAREALASSYNVPAVELAERLGTPSLLHTLRLAGFTSLERDAEHYGLGLALGNGDVTLIELANAYRALANGGVWRPWTWRALPDRGALQETTSRRVVSPLASAIVLDILSDPAARIPGFGRATPFDFPFPVAVKTGTSRHFTDNWAVGTSRRLTVAVWAGNFSGRPMEGVSGVSGAGPLLHRAMMLAARRYPPGTLTTPAEAGAVAVPVCRLSGMRATDECERLTEWFAPGTEPHAPDDWERGGRVRLPDEYAAWAASALHPAAGVGAEDEATARAMLAGVAPAGPPAREGHFRIVSPLDGDRYAVPAGVPGAYATIALRAAGRGAERVRWFVDERPWPRERWPLTPGAHVVRAHPATGEAQSVRIVVDSP